MHTFQAASESAKVSFLLPLLISHLKCNHLVRVCVCIRMFGFLSCATLQTGGSEHCRITPSATTSRHRTVTRTSPREEVVVVIMMITTRDTRRTPLPPVQLLAQLQQLPAVSVVVAVEIVAEEATPPPHQHLAID